MWVCIIFCRIQVPQGPLKAHSLQDLQVLLVGLDAMVLVVSAGPTRVAMLTLAMPPLPGPIMVLIPPWCHKRQVPRPRCRPLQDLPLPVIATGALAWKQSMEHAITRPWDGQALLRVAQGSIRVHSFANVGIVATRRVFGPQGPCLGLCRCLRSLRLRSLRRDVEDLEEGAHCDDATRPSRGLLNLLVCEEDRHGAGRSDKGRQALHL